MINHTHAHTINLLEIRTCILIRQHPIIQKFVITSPFIPLHDSEWFLLPHPLPLHGSLERKRVGRRVQRTAYHMFQRHLSALMKMMIGGNMKQHALHCTVQYSTVIYTVAIQLTSAQLKPSCLLFDIPSPFLLSFSPTIIYLCTTLFIPLSSLCHSPALPLFPLSSMNLLTTVLHTS